MKFFLFSYLESLQCKERYGIIFFRSLSNIVLKVLKAMYKLQIEIKLGNNYIFMVG